MSWAVVADKLANWFSTLKFNDALSVLLILILASIIGGGVWWVGATVLPTQTKLINEGFDRINIRNASTIEMLESAHRAERTTLHQNYKDQLDTITESFKDAMMRQEQRETKRDDFLERMIDRMDYSFQKLEKVEKKIDSTIPEPVPK